MGNREFAEKLMAQAVSAATNKTNPSDLTTAYQLFASACVADPTWGDGWYQYSNNNFDLRKLEAAVAGYRRVLQCDIPDDTRAKAMLNMGWCFHLLGQTQDAYDITIAAGEINPNLIHYWLHLSVLNGLFGNCTESVEAAERGVELSQKELDLGNADKAFLERQFLGSADRARFCLAVRRPVQARVRDVRAAFRVATA